MRVIATMTMKAMMTNPQRRFLSVCLSLFLSPSLTHTHSLSSLSTSLLFSFSSLSLSIASSISCYVLSYILYSRVYVQNLSVLMDSQIKQACVVELHYTHTTTTKKPTSEYTIICSNEHSIVHLEVSFFCVCTASLGNS